MLVYFFPSSFFEHILHAFFQYQKELVPLAVETVELNYLSLKNYSAAECFAENMDFAAVLAVGFGNLADNIVVGALVG